MSRPPLTLFACLVVLASSALAEIVVFEESFGTPTGGLYCDPAFPAGWTRIDVDSRVPNASVAYVDEAWVTYDDPFDAANCTALSTSWYEPVGAADDWMITPLIHVPQGAVLSWRAFAGLEDPDADGYEVRYSVAGTAPSDFLAHDALLSIELEETSWKSRAIDLDAADLAGRAVYFAFRNNSDDDYLLYVDDVKVAFDDTVFREEFGGVDGSGLCDPLFPAGWMLHDVDGSTPDPGVDWVSDAWVAHDTSPDNAADCAAFSTSAYLPPGQADDWMITPPIAIPPAAELRWEASAFTGTAGFEDGYEVRHSTTGSAVSDFTAPPLFSIAAESMAWSARAVDLETAGLTGLTVRFAFRNHSVDKDLLAIDAVAVAQRIVFRDGFESGLAGAWSAAAGFGP